MSKFRCNGETECGKRCKLKRKFSEMENVYCKIHENQQNEICSICLNSTKSRIKIQCEHVFCKECIIKWICVNRNCPMCRTDIEDTKIIEQSIKFGIKNKLLIYMEECSIKISNADNIIIFNALGIHPGLYLDEQDWEFSKNILHFIDNNILDNLEISFRKCLLRVGCIDEYNYYKRYNKLFLFD